MRNQCTLNAHGRRDAATRAMVTGCAVEILFLKPPRDGLAGQDGLRAGLVAGSFTVVKRNAFATGRERVSSVLVLEGVVDPRARGVVQVNAQTQTITSDHQFGCAHSA
jgi:hypothetical protein